MTELRFSQALYSGRAIDAALAKFEPYGRFEREVVDGAWVVRVAAADPARTRRLAGAFANYALGLTVEYGGADDAVDATEATS